MDEKTSPPIAEGERASVSAVAKVTETSESSDTEVTTDTCSDSDSVCSSTTYDDSDTDIDDFFASIPLSMWNAQGTRLYSPISFNSFKIYLSKCNLLQ